MTLAVLFLALAGSAWGQIDGAPVEVPVVAPVAGPAISVPVRLDPGYAFQGAAAPRVSLPSATKLAADPAAALESAGAAQELSDEEAVPVQAVLASVPAQRTGDAASPLPSRTLESFRALPPRARAAVLSCLEVFARSQGDVSAYRDAFQELAVQDEAEHIEPRLRAVAMEPGRRDDIAAKTYFQDVRWYHRFDRSVDPDGNGVPYGRAFPDNRIGMFVHRDWRKSPDFVGQLRVLFAHEYTHRLQNEGEYTTRYGVEIPAVATELLRGLELFGLDGLRRGMVSFIGDGVLGQFDSGRAWTREPAAAKASTFGFHYKGFLAGAAYELAVKTGRWEDAWLFHRLVSTRTPPLEAEQRVLQAR